MDSRNWSIPTPTESASSSAAGEDLLLSGEYEVFLSFCGKDTRYGFTDFLYTDLQGAGVRTFRDDNELRVGEEIGPEVLKAIKDSKVLIPIFSKNYAYSKWCLLELTHMVECQAEAGGEKMIFPIFYDVDPSDVTHQSGSYEEAFRQHEKKRRVDENTVQSWKEALIKVGQFKGVELKKENTVQSWKETLIKVGQFKGVELKKETDGQVGVILLIVYEEDFRQLGENKHLDEKTVQSWKEALTEFGQLERLELKKETGGREGKLVKIVVEKVLLLLEKNCLHVPKNLVGMDNHIEELRGLLKVDSNGVRIVGIHGMGGLGKTTIAEVIYNQLCERFESHCFLSNIRENSKHRDGIVSLQRQLISKILNRKVSKFSDVNEGITRIKDAVYGRKVLIVLDDVDESSQIDMLMGHHSGFGAQSRIIITTRDKNVLDAIEMTCQREDLLDVMYYQPYFMDDYQSLQLFSKYAFMRDSPMEGYDILAKEVVSIAAGLPLALVVLGSAFFGMKDRDLWEETLRKLRVTPHNKFLEMLRFSFEALDYEQKQIFLDIACMFTGWDKTRPCYMWDDCKLDPREAISVLVSRSLITVGDDNALLMHDQLRNLGRQVVFEEGLKEPGKRSRLWCKEEAMHILETHQGTRNVEALHLDFAAEDLEFHSNRLVREDFVNLPNLRFLKLGSVDLDGDFKDLFLNLRWLEWAPLGNFSPINCHLKNLVILDLSYSQITDDWKGWSQIMMAEKLKVLNLSHCYSLTTTTHFSMLATLEQLILSSCFGLVEIGPLFGNLINLRALDLSNCLVLRGMLDCTTFSKLESLDVHSCTRICGFYGLGELKSLRNLNTSGCRFLERLFDLSNSKMLRKLDTSGCVKLTEIQGLDKLNYLERLDMSGCLSMKRLPDISKLEKLEEVNIAKCDKLLEVESLGDLESLVTLDMSWCTSLESIPNLSKFKHLKKLGIGGFKDLKEILGLEEVKSLELLDIGGCKSIEKLPEISNLKQLKEIYACRCVKLIEIRGLEELWSLELLDISGCMSIEKLPDLSNLKRLKVIKASGCLKLSEMRGLEELKSLALLDLSGCKSLGNLPYLPSTTIEIFY